MAFNPPEGRLVHIEPSMDASAWDVRDERYKRKFEAGKKYIPKLFEGLDVPSDIDQVALFYFASKANRQTIGGGRIQLVSELLSEILSALRGQKVASNAVPENFALLRTLQFVADNSSMVIDVLGSPGSDPKPIEDNTSHSRDSK